MYQIINTPGKFQFKSLDKVKNQKTKFQTYTVIFTQPLESRIFVDHYSRYITFQNVNENVLYSIGENIEIDEWFNQNLDFFAQLLDHLRTIADPTLIQDECQIIVNNDCSEYMHFSYDNKYLVRTVI